MDAKLKRKWVSGWSRRPPEHASRSIPPSDGLSGETGQDALAGIAHAVKSAQPTVSNDRIPEQPETAYAANGQVAGVAPGPSEAIPAAPLADAPAGALREAATELVRRAEGVIHSDAVGNRFRKVFAYDLDALSAALSARER